MADAIKFYLDEYVPPAVDQTVFDQIEKAIKVELTDALDTKKYSKLESYAKVDECKAKAKALFEGDTDEAKAKQTLAGKYFDMLKEKIFREEMMPAFGRKLAAYNDPTRAEVEARWQSWREAAQT